MSQTLPVVAADLTRVALNGGVAYSAITSWDEDDEPTVGQHVLAGDGGPRLEAVIDEIDCGRMRLRVLKYAK